ncbi:MAG: hypothetical protein KTR31_03050 [Myxococcales bacterium]|nr:hypothetical protein [Myxococcales bacterium]
MGQWLVTQGNNQFSVEGLDELEDLARRGQLSGGDMLQPPGSNEWIYVSEVEELKALIAPESVDDLDLDYRRSGGSNASVIAAALLALIVVGGGAMFYFAQQLPSGNASLLGEGGLTFSQMIVTEPGTGLRSEPDERSTINHPLPKDSVLELIAKRGEWYRARAEAGQEGWIGFSQVIPMYQLGGADVRDEFDPLYNPDRYVEVINARWMQLPNERPKPGEDLYSNITVFEFMMKNSSRYPMTGLVLQATIKDAKGQEIETVEISIEGMIPSDGSTMVGTLLADEDQPVAEGEEPEDRKLTTETFDAMAELDPDLQMRWKSGVEVPMETSDGAFTNAEIDIVELRAIPDEDAAEVVRRDLARE